MYVHADIHIFVNGKERSETVELDLSIASKNLDEFKKHILSESRLSPGEHERYMLSYLYSNYSHEWTGDEEAKISTVYMPIIRNDDLRIYIL